ncbi:MAG: hypothetical protein JNK72_20250 [Myxococcales bacterium]|nr:hypothetical protein [Myxococcales bacterium]
MADPKRNQPPSKSDPRNDRPRGRQNDGGRPNPRGDQPRTGNGASTQGRPPRGGVRRSGPPSPSGSHAQAPRAGWEDPNGYRSPGFQDAPQGPAAIDYAGLPRDDDAAEAETAEGAAPKQPANPNGAANQAPRGMGRRGSDRVGDDVNAYRGPGFRDANQRSWARPPTAAERNAAIVAAGVTPAVSDEAEPDDDSQAAMLARAEARRPRRR